MSLPVLSIEVRHRIDKMREETGLGMNVCRRIVKQQMLREQITREFVDERDDPIRAILLEMVDMIAGNY